MDAPPAQPMRALKRRNTARIDAEFDVDMTSEHNFFTGFSEDLSEGGVFIATYEPRRIGEHLAIAFRLPGDETPIRAVVEVKWMREQNFEASVPPVKRVNAVCGRTCCLAIGAVTCARAPAAASSLKRPVR